MKAVFDAILTKFNASTSLKNAATGGLWRENVPQKTAYPFIVFRNVAGYPRDTFTERAETIEIEFIICAQGPSDDTADTIAGYLMAAFDWTTLTVSGYSFTAMARMSNSSDYDHEEDVWTYTIRYAVMVQKTA